MRKYKEVIKNDFVLESTTCDSCGKVASPDTDIMDFQEWVHLHFIGGYESVFEDGGEYECDFCQQCTKKILGKYLRYIGNRI